jgi:DNA repair exonuclease SbcCD ATPase subunit
MKQTLIRKSAIVIFATMFLCGFLFIDSSAQKRRRKTRRRPTAPRITNPEIYQPPANDNSNSNATDANVNATQPTEDPDSMKKTIRGLSDQVDRLNQKLGQVEQSQQSMVDLERLSRAEQRSAQLRSELRDVQQKKGDLEAHLEDVEYALKPENIERATAGYGTTRPEDVREQRRKQLENERDRVRKQLAEFQASEDRLQQAIATSDAEVDRLQKKLDAADRTDIENAKTRSRAEASPSPTPTP